MMRSGIRFPWGTSISIAALVAGSVAFGCSNDSAIGPDGGADADSSDSSQDGSGTGARAGTGSASGSGGRASGTGASSGTGSSTGAGTGGASSGANKSCGISSEPSLGGARPISTDFEQCASASERAETAPADIFIMIDQSISMGDNLVVPSDPASLTRWEALTEALKGFIQSPDSAGLRVGLQYFGLNNNGAVLCDVEAYNSADVEIDELPGNADALTESIDAHFPASSTPSVPALEGALKYAQDWAKDHPDRKTLVVFATDGYPTECERSQISELEAVAKAYAEPTDGSPRVPTFVVGIGPVANLERVAVAGGTSHAFFVADCPTSVADLQTALGRIASSPVGCEFAIPRADGEIVDTSKINFSLTVPGGSPVTIPRLDGESTCGNGWYFDDNDVPTKIIACPNTCSQFGVGVVDIVIGCETVILK